MFSPAIHCRDGFHPPVQGFNPMHSPAIHRRDFYPDPNAMRVINSRRFQPTVREGVGGYEYASHPSEPSIDTVG